MSIASRTTSIEEHIGNAYNKLEDLGIDLTNVDKNIDNIAEMLDTVYEEYPKVTGTGTELTLDGTKAGKLSLDIKGNSTQDGTPTPTNEVPIYSAGDDINLFDKNNANIINAYINNGTITEASNGKSLYISCKPNTTYIILRNAGTRFRAVDTSVVPAVGVVGSDYVGADTSSSITITTNANAKYLCVNYYNRNTDGADEQSILDSIKIYAPRSISEKIVNKNLFDKNDTSKILFTYIGSQSNAISSNASSSSKFRIVFIKCLPNTTYQIKSFSGESLKRLGVSTSSSIPTYGTQLIETRSPTGNYYEYTTISEAKWLVVQITSTGTEDVQDVIDSFMISIGDTEPTTYIANQTQTYTIPVQQPMRSIGTVRDEFIQDTEGNWFERHNIARYICKGNETLLNQTVLETVSRWIIQMTGAKTGSALSNYYTYYANYTASTEHFYVSNNQILTFHDRTITSGAQYLQYFAEKYASGNPVYFDYQLATPVDLPCTQEQIAILENLPKSYNEQTNIYSIDTTPAYLEAKALKGE